MWTKIRLLSHEQERDCLDVGFALDGRWILAVWIFDFDCMDVGFWLGRFCILIVWTLGFGCVDVGF